jgi:hypothetical protein
MSFESILHFKFLISAHVVQMSKKQFSDVFEDSKNVSDSYTEWIITTTGEKQT